jgi:Kef-type K+ transport system membrane component KefB
MPGDASPGRSARVDPPARTPRSNMATGLTIATAAAAATSDLLPLLLALAALVAGAKVVGSLSVRLGQPAVLGELLAGLLLGPTFLNLTALPPFESPNLGKFLHLLGQLGVLWLMFAAGLEAELADLRQSGRPALFGGVLGVVVPLGLGLGAGLAFRFPLEQAVFLGLTLSATSVSISAQTLLELDRLRTREGAALLGAAVIDDILVIILLSLVVATGGGSADIGGILLQLGRMLLVLFVVVLIAVYLLPSIAEWSRGLRVSEGLLALVLASVLFLGWMVESIGGVAAITGAFVAGVGLGRTHLRDEIERALHPIAYGFFVPLFLVDIGLQADVRALGGPAFVFTLVVVATAIASKIVGSGLGARLGGFGSSESFRMGLGMISRGEVGLIVAGVGVAEGMLPLEEFSVVVVMVIVTTLVTPPLLRIAFGRKEGDDAATG